MRKHLAIQQAKGIHADGMVQTVFIEYVQTYHPQIAWR